MTTRRSTDLDVPPRPLEDEAPLPPVTPEPVIARPDVLRLARALRRVRPSRRTVARHVRRMPRSRRPSEAWLPLAPSDPQSCHLHE